MAKKLVSWNVNGIRAAMKKGMMDSMSLLQPDVLCIQETKAQDDQVVEALKDLSGYHLYSNSAVKKGYSGTAILSKEKPLSVTPDIGLEEHDQEGRVLCAEYKEYYVVTVYVPNSKRGLERLDDRTVFDAEFLKYLKKLEETKPVIVCGDFNVSHKDIDLARPKPNYDKNAGFMQREIDGMDNYVAGGFVDTFREKYEDQEGAYTWWSYMGGARERNVGWRIDYFLVSDSLKSKIKDAAIHPDHMESDHCPISVDMEI